jgi:hypothetical protein
MSAITAPIGRRRTQAAISASVGSASGASGSSARRAAGRAGLARGRRGTGLGLGVQPDGVLHQPRLQCAGAQQTAPDAQQDQREVADTERTHDGARVGGGALVQGDGEIAAELDQLADQAEQTLGPAGGGRLGKGGRGGHERNKSTGGRQMARNIFRDRWLR